MEFASKLTATPEGVSSGDIALLISANMSVAAILDGTLVVAGFNLINRVASARHFEHPLQATSFLALVLARLWDIGSCAALRCGHW